MSAPNAPSTPAAIPSTAPDRAPLPWGLWGRQTAAVMRLELRRSFLGRRAMGLYFLALIPVLTLGARALAPLAMLPGDDLPRSTELFANVYQSLILRLVVFFGCAEIFGNLVRRELLDRSLHYYFLTPVRREVLAAGKYLTGLVVAAVLFGASTAVTFALAYQPHGGASVARFLLSGPGLGHLAAYLLVTLLGCLGYGAVFLTFGFFAKSPAIPAVAVFGWEAMNFLLPPFLKKVSVIHYLVSLCPVPVSQGPLAVLADPTSPWVAIPGLAVVTAALLAVSAWRIRRMEISYEEH